jgi:hypothetical protein
LKDHQTFEEEGLSECVEFGESLAALGPQRLRLIQNRRNPPLFLGVRNQDFQPIDIISV